ncbi:MAG TPA: hypothetical protein PLJ99_06535 [Kiritimatiellia bacterium]|jgi:hypothetical protein|nr:hypothetical protein [Kiritimatiellia bacterium]HPR68930.1 hypothetical protein [Kiritimatiellia bacterium]HRX06578.1 hypothetical protein [Kiritimatiellia bacterium]
MFSSNGLSVMTLLAVLLLAAVVALQVVEINTYSAIPSLWP